MTAPTASPLCDLNRSDFADSLVFSEEVDIKQGMGLDLDSALAFPAQALRLLIFAHRRREGDTVKQARAFAKELPRGACIHYFAPDEDQTADQGKDEPSD